MKNNLWILTAIILCVSCSAPKYTYKFDHYDYNSGKNKHSESAVVLPAPGAGVEEESPLLLTDPVFTAEVSSKPETIGTPKNNLPNEVERVEPSLLERNYKSLNKAERKEFRKEMKTEVKKYVKAIKSGDHISTVEQNAPLDNDLKLAIIFGAVGLALSLFGGISEVFSILGVISILVGLYFLIKWLVRQ